jgi:hypothetical protein
MGLASKIASISAVFLLAAVGTPAVASTLLFEDFSGGVPGSYSGSIAGTQFGVTTASVDLLGVLNGSFFTCTNNSGGNCLDLVGTTGQGGIASVPTFTLKAGDTYTVNFGAILQGYDPGQGSTTFSVGLGTLTQNETVNGTAKQFSVSFIPTASQSSAALSFTTIIPGDQVHGAVVDRIILTDTAPVGGVPEPATWAMMLVGFGGIGVAARSRRFTRLVNA